MDNRALFKLSYGVFVLTSKSGEKENGCIINTCMQVANSPARIAISVMNRNFTCDFIKESGKFALSLLDETVTFETIRHWGFQSGRNVDKMDGLALVKDCNGMSYLPWQTCAAISATVVESHDLGSHTLFVAEVDDAVSLSDNAPLTYADYQNKVQPKPQEVKKEKKIVGWRCKICKYEYKGEELPADFVCPLCGHGVDDFEPIYE